MSLPRRFRATVAVAAALSGMALLTVPAPAADGRAVPPPGCTGPASSTWLNVTVEGLRNSHGPIAVTLYADNSRKFLVRHGSIYVGRAAAQANSMRTCIFVPQPGIYVLALYHDENGNQKFDRTGIGLPAEGYGFSNNPSTLAVLPSFRSVRLAVPHTGLATRVHMKYP